MTNKTESKKRVWKVYGRCNGKPAGFVGQFRTKADADRARRSCHVSTRVVQATISQADYDLWASRGYKPRGWLTVEEVLKEK